MFDRKITDGEGREDGAGAGGAGREMGAGGREKRLPAGAGACRVAGAMKERLFIENIKPSVAQPKVVALTGPIAGGKSLALSLFARLGVATIDADDVAHGLYAAGGALVPALAAMFGTDVLAADGSVDRKALAKIVFSDPSAMAVLNTTTHPLIRAKLAEWRDGVRASGGVGVAAIPLLFESGMAGDWDATACLTVPDEVLLPRLAARGLDESAARARLASQWSPAEKAARANYLLPNESTREALAAVCASFAAFLRGGAERADG